MKKIAGVLFFVIVGSFAFFQFHVQSVQQLDLCSQGLPYSGSSIRTQCRETFQNLQYTPTGPRVYIRAEESGLRSIESISDLKMAGQNFENLGRFVEIQIVEEIVSGKTVKRKVERILEKSEPHKKRMALRLKKMDPDILVGTEVQDIDVAQRYVNEHLDEKYKAILIEGNDPRGIDICFFVKKDLPFDFEVQSNKEVKREDGKPIFSRDLPVMFARPKGADPASRPLFAVVGTHYRSQKIFKKEIEKNLQEKPEDQKDDQKDDQRRTEQVLSTVKILNDLNQKFENLPVFMSGDFNNDVRNSPEFNPLYQWGLKDSMDFAPNAPPRGQRFTQYFSMNGEILTKQLDVILVSPMAQAFVKLAGIQRDLDDNGVEKPMPRKSNHINARASDHDGVTATIDFSQIYNLYLKFFSSNN